MPEDRGAQGLVRPMSVLHNLSLAALGERFRTRASSIASPSGVWPKRRSSVSASRPSSPDEIAGRLSGGNQQKIVLGKWLANNPKLLDPR